MMEICGKKVIFSLQFLSLFVKVQGTAFLIYLVNSSLTSEVFLFMFALEITCLTSISDYQKSINPYSGRVDFNVL